MENCDGNDKMPYKCRQCGLKFCSDHRLPEKHNCIGLAASKPPVTQSSSHSSTGSSGSTSGGGLVSITLGLILLSTVVAGGVFLVGGVDSVPPDGIIPDIEVNLDSPVDKVDSSVDALENATNTSNSLDNEQVARLVYNETNAFRYEQSKPDLYWNKGLSQVARDHSQYMASIGKSTHRGAGDGDVNDRLRDSGHPCAGQAGENVAKTYYNVEMSNGHFYSTPEELATGIVEMFANSEGHREIMLGDHDEIGVGVSVAEDEGHTAVYVTQIYC